MTTHQSHEAPPELILTPTQYRQLAALFGPTQAIQSAAMGVSPAQHTRYLRDGVTAKCSNAVKAHMVGLAKSKGVI